MLESRNCAKGTTLPRFSFPFGSGRRTGCEPVLCCPTLKRSSDLPPDPISDAERGNLSARGFSPAYSPCHPERSEGSPASRFFAAARIRMTVGGRSLQGLTLSAPRSRMDCQSVLLRACSIGALEEAASGARARCPKRSKEYGEMPPLGA